MTNVFKNKIVQISVVLGIIAVAAVSFFAIRASAQPSSITVQQTATATTSVAYIGVGTATSTYQIDSYPTFSSSKAFSMAGIDSVQLYVQYAASSTSSVLNITPQFSNNGIDWFTPSFPTVNGTTIVNATSTTVLGGVVTYQWTPGTTATSSLTLPLPSYPALHERIVFTGSGAAGALYAEVVLKKNPSTP